MSIHEKIQLWGAVSPQESPENLKVNASSPESFNDTEANGDVDDETEDQEDPEKDNEARNLVQNAYRKAILDSKAYQWLLSSLIKQSSLHWGGSQPYVIADGIRKKVLQKLSTGTISRKQPPRSFKVVFKLLWEPIQTRITRERARRSTNPAAFVLADLTALTCTSETEAQVTTVREYFKRTWPDGGLDIIGKLQRFLDGKSDIYSPSGESFSPPLNGRS
jgi:hypothetical protein